MPWNFVSCVSSSASAPVSTRASPSAMVPRKKWLASLIPSFGEGRFSVDIAQVPPFTAQCIERRDAITASVLAEDSLQNRMHVLRHRARVSADIDRGAIPHPRIDIVPRFPQRVLHVALLRLVTRERNIE